MAKVIELTRGKVAIVDDADFELVSKYKWSYAPCKGGSHYALRGVKNSLGRPSVQLMHHLVMGPSPPGYEIDHVNGDGLDNRRGNLRFVTRAQNQRNCQKRSRNKSSRYKGVSFDRKAGARNPWRAQIGIGDGRVLRLGNYRTEQEAALVYDEAARKHFGEYACTNFRNDGSIAPWLADLGRGDA